MLRRAVPFIVFAVLAAALLWPLFAGRVLIPASMLGKMAPWDSGGDAHWNALTWDGIAYFYPARHFLGESLRTGRLPLWNPHQMCGMPFLASPQSAVLYPPNWLFGILPTDIAFGVLAFLHLFAAGSFTYLFLRKLGLCAPASVFGGSAFMLSGWSIVWLHLPVFLSSGVWLPVTLLLITVAWERSSALHAVLAGGAIALSLFGGHPQIWAYVLMTSGLYWVYLAAVGRRKTTLIRTAGLAALTFTVGFLLAAPQLLPTAELAALSHRGGSAPTSEGFRAYNALSIPVRGLLAFIIPDFFGNPTKDNFWGAGEYTEFCGYIGILPLLLAPFAFTGRGRRNAVFFGLLAAISLLLATGTDVNRMLYFGIPGFSRSGSPARVIFVYTFAAAVLGSIGLERLPALKSRRAAACIASAAGLVAAALLLFTANARYVADAGSVSAVDLLASAYAPISAALLLLAVSLLGMLLAASRRLNVSVTGGILIVILAADLLAFGFGYNVFSTRADVYRRASLIDAAQDGGLGRVMPLNDEWRLRQFPRAVLPPNAATFYGLYDVQGYDSLYPVRYKRLADAGAGRDSSPPENGNMVFARNPESPVWDLLGVTRFLLREGEIRRNAGALPRAFVVHAVRRASDAQSLELLAEGRVNPRGTALADTAALRGPERPSASSARITAYSGDRVTVRVSNPDAAGMLVLTDQMYPGWTAAVNGRAVSVHRADYCLRGVEVPRGHSAVEFTFKPRSLYRGCYLALVGLLILCGLLGKRLISTGGRR